MAEMNNYTKAAIKTINIRLDKFESAVLEKLEQLTDAMIKLARTEEKLVNYDAKFGYIEAHIKKLDAEMEVVKSKQTLLEKEGAVDAAKTDIYGHFLKKGVWLIMMAAAGFIGARSDTVLSHLLTIFGG